MKTLTIEWRHFAKDNSTCDRCSGTGRNLKALVRRMQKCGCGCARVELKETILDGTKGSNAILLNGIPLEKALPSASVGQSHCSSCSELTARKTSCRTLKHGATTYETIPLKLLHKAACGMLQCCG